MPEGKLAQRDRPVHGQPGHAAQLAELKAWAPGRGLAQLPAIEQACQGRATLLLFQAQLGGFAVGQQKAAPARKRVGIIGLARVVQARQHRPVQVSEGVVHLLALPGAEAFDVTHPTRLDGPLKAL
ncbi:hypothetical protein D3C72_1884730 [compost metagenome]